MLSVCGEDECEMVRRNCELALAIYGSFLEKPQDLKAVLQKKYHVYDLWQKKYLGHTDSINLSLYPWRPALFALTTVQVPEEEIIPRLTPD
jgi:hypothetical protein